MNTAIGGHYSENEDKGAFMSHIHDLAAYAAARNVTLALEVHGDITASGAMAVEVIKEIDRPNVRINYDTANAVFYGNVDPVKDISIAAPYLAHVHLKDTAAGYREWNFPAISEGHVDFKGVLKNLKDAGYKAPFSVEIEFSGEPWPSLAEVDRSMKVSYQALSKLGLK
jgi:L-ribulose-5-phosphate 3-epimerase